ncbi:hypothetical protein IUJ58_21520 [Priestia aryabhattai]|nr:hypothetical protein [Priestia aryabhattai]MBU3573532.1 hypothetical protein [Priestia aryabhattai]WDL86500.1 hypothetical protein IUJ58_21520 [Priestia aryabhattai]
MYWIAKGYFNVSFERFVRKWLYVFGIVLMLSSIWLLGVAVYQLII